ncbi:MAG: RimK family alpha-L-glutamate ligase [Phycisphaerales bacterium]|nr:MAG: RimK family alpha-L-glutamate ligase [Phycisphaerales bacterium]
MKLAILSRQPRAYSTRRLREAAIKRGHETIVRDTLAFSISLEEVRPDLYYRSKRFPLPDAVIPRIGSSITYFGAAVLRQLEQMDVFCLNSAASVTTSRDKLRAMQVLSRHELGMPPTELVRSASDVSSAIERLGGCPVVIKVLEGTQGVGVMLAESVKTAQAIVETLKLAKQNVLIQKFIAESKGCDVRALVVGERVVAAMRRRAKPGEFRSNVHRGGSTEIVPVTPELEELAVRSSQILGLRVAGVDMLESESGPLITEVNSSPGLEGIENATGIDVADAIIEYTEQRVQFGDIDIRQRLTVSKGYGVGELRISPESGLAGRTIGETEVAELGLVVLTLSRDRKVTPNPGPGAMLQAGDKLLCFGKLEAMRGLISHQRPRRKRKARIPGKNAGGA